MKAYSAQLLFLAVFVQFKTVEALCGWGDGLEGAGWGERLVAASWFVDYGLIHWLCFRVALVRPALAFGLPLAMHAFFTMRAVVEHGVVGLIGVLFLYFLFWRPFVAARKLEWLRRGWKHDLPGDVA